MAHTPDSHKYDDIIHLSRPVSGRHARMPLADRGAQFSPFAALTGHAAVLEEAARQYDDFTELADGGAAMLDEKLRILAQRLDSQPEATFTVFRWDSDSPKGGGNYVTVSGQVKQIDTAHKCILLKDGRRVLIPRIYDVQF